MLNHCAMERLCTWKKIYFYKRIWYKTIEYKGNKFIDFCDLNSYSLKETIKRSSKNVEVHWLGKKRYTWHITAEEGSQGYKRHFQKMGGLTFLVEFNLSMIEKASHDLCFSSVPFYHQDDGT